VDISAVGILILMGIFPFLEIFPIKMYTFFMFLMDAHKNAHLFSENAYQMHIF
jgi:hypothetical protein